MSCSLVVPTRHRPQSLRRCLSAVAADASRPEEVVVVDNSAGDEATRATAIEFGAQYVVEPVAGAARARNAGARHAGGEVIAFLDDDVVPRPGWLPALLAPFHDPSVLGVTGRIAPPEAPLAPDGGTPQFIRSFDLGSERRTFDQASPWWFETTNFGGVGFGMIMAIRASVFERWPGFHPGIGPGTTVPAGDENYAFFELLRLGGRIVYTPDAVVQSAEGTVRATLRSQPASRVSEAAAHATLLLVEGRGYRMRTLRFVLEGLVGKRRPWRPPAGETFRSQLSAYQFGAALARGSWRYLAWRLHDGRRSGGHVRPGPPARVR